MIFIILYECINKYTFIYRFANLCIIVNPFDKKQARYIHVHSKLCSGAKSAILIKQRLSIDQTK